MSHYLQIPTPASSGRVDFNALYAMTGEQVNELLNYLDTSSFIDDIKLLFNTPVENIVSLRVYPFSVRDNTDLEEKPEDTAILINTVNTGVLGYSLDNQSLKVLEAGYFVFPKQYFNFLDYAPYTTIDLYLPYIGFVKVEPQLVLGKITYVDYVADLASGKCTAFISIADGVDSETKDIIMSCDGTIGHEIQIGGGQGAEIARNMLKLGIGATAGTIATVAGAIATGGASAPVTAVAAAGAVSGGVSLLANTAVNAITAGQVHVNKGSATQPTISAYAPQQPYAIITRPTIAEPTSYARDYGKPCGKTLTLGTLTGFTVVDSIHVERLDTATSDEVTEVERLLKQGVIL